MFLNIDRRKLEYNPCSFNLLFFISPNVKATCVIFTAFSTMLEKWKQSCVEGTSTGFRNSMYSNWGFTRIGHVYHKGTCWPVLEVPKSHVQCKTWERWSCHHFKATKRSAVDGGMLSGRCRAGMGRWFICMGAMGHAQTHGGHYMCRIFLQLTKALYYSATTTFFFAAGIT